jgi:hypothetical protein
LPALTILYDSAFHSKDYSFCEIFVHETIHRSGIKEFWAAWTWIPLSGSFAKGVHDLSGYKQYKEIIQGCDCQGVK